MNQPSYVPGDFYRICSTCGSKMRASQTFRTWDGRYVCAEDFETRHPQDFVRGHRDNQTVPSPRPEPVVELIGPLTTTLSDAASPGSTSLTVETTARFQSDDSIGIVCDGGTVTRIVDVISSATVLTITQRLGDNARVGAVIINYSAIAEADIG